MDEQKTEPQTKPLQISEKLLFCLLDRIYVSMSSGQDIHHGRLMLCPDKNIIPVFHVFIVPNTIIGDLLNGHKLIKSKILYSHIQTSS